MARECFTYQTLSCEYTIKWFTLCSTADQDAVLEYTAFHYNQWLRFISATIEASSGVRFLISSWFLCISLLDLSENNIINSSSNCVKSSTLHFRCEIQFTFSFIASYSYLVSNSIKYFLGLECLLILVLRVIEGTIFNVISNQATQNSVGQSLLIEALVLPAKKTANESVWILGLEACLCAQSESPKNQKSKKENFHFNARKTKIQERWF